MTNSKATKKALFSSALAVILCVAMLIGTTFAWFTDNATANVNRIKTGKLGITLEQYDESTASWVELQDDETIYFKSSDTDILWEPGCRYELPKLRVTNDEDLAVMFKIVITGINGDAVLNDVIDWTIDDFALNGTEEKLLAGDSKEFTIKGTMQTSAGNEYQDKSIDGISITVSARQAMEENDSIDDTYDRDSEYQPIQRPTTPTYTVTTATQLQSVLTSVNATAYGQVVNIGADFELQDGETWTPLNMNSYTGISKLTINGNNHTIKGLNDALLGYCNFGNVEITIKDLTLTNSTVKKTAVENNNTLGIGAFIAAADSTSKITLENCHLKNSEVDFQAVDNNHKVTAAGGLIGYASCNLDIIGCSVDNTKVTANYSSAGAVAGHVSATTTNTTNITNAKVTGCTVKGKSVDKSGYVLGTAHQGTTVITTNDCANNKVFETQNSDKVYGRLVGGNLTVNGSSAS